MDTVAYFVVHGVTITPILLKRLADLYQLFDTSLLSSKVSERLIIRLFWGLGRLGAGVLHTTFLLHDRGRNWFVGFRTLFLFLLLLPFNKSEHVNDIRCFDLAVRPNRSEIRLHSAIV